MAWSGAAGHDSDETQIYLVTPSLAALPCALRAMGRDEVPAALGMVPIEWILGHLWAEGGQTGLAPKGSSIELNLLPPWQDLKARRALVRPGQATGRTGEQVTAGAGPIGSSSVRSL